MTLAGRVHHGPAVVDLSLLGVHELELMSMPAEISFIDNRQYMVCILGANTRERDAS
jgi:hypothetical protein